MRTRTQGWNLEARTDAEAKEEYCLLACATCFLTHPMAPDPDLGVAPLTVSWYLQYQSLTKKMSTGQSAGSFLYWGSLFSENSTMDQVDKNNQPNNNKNKTEQALQLWSKSHSCLWQNLDLNLGH